MSDMRWTVGEVAEMAGVTVRTLHHYDEIGLLVPSERSEAGYRLYSRADLERLQEILLHRETGLGLDDIARLLDDPEADRAETLRAHRAFLLEKRARLERVIETVDRTLASIKEGTAMSTEEMFEGFEELTEAPDDVRAHHREHAAEAHERWGDTSAWTESARRTKSYSKEQWADIRREAEATESRMAELLAEGVAPESEKGMAGAEAMRRHIDRWFYPCSPRMHAGLADMYETDDRFRENYEKRAEGLAAFVAAAIRANAAHGTS